METMFFRFWITLLIFFTIEGSPINWKSSEVYENVRYYIPGIWGDTPIDNDMKSTFDVSQLQDMVEFPNRRTSIMPRNTVEDQISDMRHNGDADATQMEPNRKDFVEDSSPLQLESWLVDTTRDIIEPAEKQRSNKEFLREDEKRLYSNNAGFWGDTPKSQENFS
uniref:Cnidarian restricted protein n=1 Tax=Clytia hemisphaerica TaxID=252671 RepID=A0A7M5WXC0_9CNID